MSIPITPNITRVYPYLGIKEISCLTSMYIAKNPAASVIIKFINLDKVSFLQFQLFLSHVLIFKIEIIIAFSNKTWDLYLVIT